jgi:PAS domain S-box-containing protein
VINTAVDGILAIDERGKIEWLNPSALRIFGYSKEELIGKNINVLMPEPYHGEHDQYLKNYRDTKHAKIIGIGREVKGKRKDGSIFPLDLAVSEVRLGSRRMFTGIIRDITQRKEAERLLVEAKETAEAANKAKDQFLAMVSHELRTPLTPILAAVSFLENRKDLPREVHEEIASIRRNVEREAQIVDDLLNLTRVARGKIELHYEVVDAHLLLRTLLRESENEIDERDLVLTTALGAKNRNLWADPKRLQQVLSNLLHNAIKFSSVNGQISVRTSNPEEGRLRIEISDSGIGIEPEVLMRLFSPFEQGEKTINRSFGGLGLGLAISKGIVDLHGGVLSATSEGKGKGATFVLELTTVPAVPEETTPAAAPTEADDRPGVLLVEDHPDTLRIMAKLLRGMGYHVTVASSVKEALRVAEGRDFAVLVSDIGLPDGSGLDIVRQLKVGRSGLKAIAVSGFGQPEDLARSREAGFSEHLIKPVNFQRLESLLRQVTNN